MSNIKWCSFCESEFMAEDINVDGLCGDCALKKQTDEKLIFKRDYFPGPGWENRILEIWVEDDVPDPDKEKTAAAMKRFTGSDRLQCKQTIDGGDHHLYLFEGGWVMCISFDGGFVGVVIKKGK